MRHFASTVNDKWRNPRDGRGTPSAQSGAAPVVAVDARWGHGEDAVQGAGDGEAAPVRDLHGTGTRAPGAAAAPVRDLGVAVRGAPLAGVPQQPGGAGFRRVVIRCMERRGVHDGRAAPPADGPSAPHRAARARAAAGVVRLAAAPPGGGGQVGARRGGGARDRRAAEPPRPRRRDGTQRPDDAALVRGGALARRWARRVRAGSHTCGGRRPVRGTGGRGRRRPYRDRAGRDTRHATRRSEQ